MHILKCGLWRVLSRFIPRPSVRKKAPIHEVTTMLAISKKVLFPGHNHLLTTGTDDLALWLSPERQRVICTGVSRWLWSGNRPFLEVAGTVVTWWIVAFLRSAILYALIKYVLTYKRTSWVHSHTVMSYTLLHEYIMLVTCLLRVAKGALRREKQIGKRD